jgi:hypothetical protein
MYGGEAEQFRLGGGIGGDEQADGEECERGEATMLKYAWTSMEDHESS